MNPFEMSKVPQAGQSAEKPKEKIWTITPEQFNQLPDGTELTSVFGEKMVKGRDEINQDTRAGYLAFGFLEADKPAGIDFDPRAVREIEEDMTLNSLEESEK
jgi:hypothetical protein